MGPWIRPIRAEGGMRHARPTKHAGSARPRGVRRDCEKLDRLKLSTTVTWRKADNTVVGDTVVKLAVDVTIPGFDPPWTLSFAGPAKTRSIVFPRDPVSFALDTTSPNWAISGACFKLSLDSLAFENGTFAADPPA